MLESTIRGKLVKKDILLMTHIVLGYPSFAESLRLIEIMVEAGVDLMELQIPFSEPVADGPVILRANQVALQRGVKVQESLDFAGRVVSTFPIPFLLMSYYNLLFRRGVASFVSSMAERGIQGAIVPDLPPEEGEDYLEAMGGRGLSPILLFSPTSPPSRMAQIASRGRGFIYCVARRGVTGAETRFSQDLARYLGDCRRATRLPLALGFGVGGKRDIDFLRGKADIAVIGSRVIHILDREGTKGVKSFIRGLLAS